MEIIRERENIRIVCHTLAFSEKPLPFHWHVNYEICQPLSPCRFLIDGQEIHAAPGDLVAIGEHTVHRFLIPQADTRVRILQFPLSALKSPAAPLLPLKQHIPLSAIRAIPGLEERISSLLSMMEGEPVLSPEDANPVLQSLAAALYFLLARHFPGDPPGRADPSARADFDRVILYVNAHYRQRLTIQSLSETLYIPRARLSSLFARYAGFSLTEYLNMLRIRQADELIAQGTPVTHAALESGFQSIRTFNSVYRRLTGSAPTGGRSAAKGEPESE